MGSTYREVITLQCGHYSNFIGTHWWNIQESAFSYDAVTLPKEINSDIFFREGQTLAGDVTYTPRLVAIDLKGSLNTLRTEGVLYDVQLHDEDLKWAADVTLHQAGSVPKNEFLTDLEKLDKLHSGEPEDVESQGSQGSADAMEIDDGERNSREPVDMTKKIYNLDYQINVWSDYLRLHLHPKTVSLVQEYEHQSESENFNAFTYGSQVMNSTKSSDDIEDRIRFFTEESDQLQGFQFSVDTFDGFSGLGCKLVEQLSDEFSSKSIITFATSPAHFPNSTTIEDSQRVINSVLSYDGLCNHSSLCLPLCVSSTLWRQPGLATNFPNLIYDANLNYHSSAILAMALETATLPYRLENNCIQMSTITDALSTMGRKLSSLSVSLPVPLSTDSSLAEMFKHYTDLSPWQPITPYCSQASPQNCFAQTVSLRGIPKQLLKSPPIEGVDLDNPLETCSNMDEMLRMYLTTVFSRTFNAGVCIEQPCKTVAPFPLLFNSKVTTKGQIDTRDREPATVVESIPVMTSMQSSSCLGDLLRTLHKEGSKLDMKKFHHYLDSGLELDDYKESLDKLKELAECYDIA